MISPSSPKVIGCGRWASCLCSDAGVDAKVGQLLGTEGVVLQHAADGMHDREGRVHRHRLIERAHAPPARISRITVVLLKGALTAGDHDVARVDDDDVLAGVDVLGELGAMLAAQDARDVGGEPAERLPAGIDEEPALLELSRLGLVGQRAGHAASS